MIVCIFERWHHLLTLMKFWSTLKQAITPTLSARFLFLNSPWTAQQLLVVNCQWTAQQLLFLDSPWTVHDSPVWQPLVVNNPWTVQLLISEQSLNSTAASGCEQTMKNIASCFWVVSEDSQQFLFATSQGTNQQLLFENALWRVL